MRNLTAVCSALALASVVACGGSSSSSSEPQPTSPEAGDAAVSPPIDGSIPDDGAARDGGPTDSSTPATLATGTVGGHAFTYAHGIAFPRSVGNGLQGYEILLSDKAIDCTGATLEGSTTVDIDVAGKPPAAKSYAVVDAFAGGGANDATSDFNVVDATCGSLLSDTSLSGTVVLTRLDATTVEGSVDITYQSKTRVKDGSVKGTFAAVVCPKFPAITCTPH